MSPGRRLFVLLYTASGAAALVYEVTWTRLLTLQLGHTVAAASTVLAAFMGGLALGAWIAARLPIRGLRAYAVLEIIVAVVALALPLALAASVPALAWAYADGAAPARFAMVRVAVSLALLGLPAAAMGATFPIAADWAGRGASGPGAAANTGVLYAANTAGAALGAIAAGFWLIPALGLRGTTWVGVALNAVAAAGAWRLAASTAIDAEPAEPAETGGTRRTKKTLRVQRVLRSTSSSLPSSSPSPVLACSAAAISGFAALIYEVAWTRLLALVVGPTTYAFATMAAAFISGLALGSALGTRIVRRTARPAVWLAAMLVTSAVSASAASWFTATHLPLIVATQVADPAVAFTRLIAIQAFGIAILLLPMTMALGATFPLALAVEAGGASTVGGDAARVYTANTAGAIAGALVAGFVLIPTVGLQFTLQAAAICGALGGAGCLAAALRRPERVVWPAIVAVAALAVIATLPSWDREMLSSGAYKYAPYLGADDVETMLHAGELAYYKEGAAATVSVRRLTGTTSLAIDGKIDASNAGDMLTQRLLGLLPVLLHGRAQDICIIGLGSGVTVGSALAAGTVRRADVIEISPEVVEASHFFDRENAGALARPGVRLIVGDGRSHLLLTPRLYDVIVSEPSNPWMSGVAALFTRQFFEAARSRLRSGGLLCQWAHTYDISADDLRSIVRTFSSVFPEGTMWLVGSGDLLLIGTTADAMAARLDRLAAASRQGTVAETLATVGIDQAHAPFNLLTLFAGGPRELERYGAGALIQTDDRMALEYSAPRGIYGRTTSDNAAAIRALGGETPAAVRAAFDGATDAAWTSNGAMQLKAEAYALAYDAFSRAVALNSRNAEALAGLSDAAAGAHRAADSRDLLQSLADREPGNAAVKVELSRVLAARGDFEAAATLAADAMRLRPDDPRPAEQLASIIADTGDADRLTPLAESLAARFPDRPDPQYYRATALFLRGRTDEAVTAARRVTDRHPEHARAQNLLGAACATLGRHDCAVAAFEASIRANPRDASAYVNLGQFRLQSGEPRAASRFFGDALMLDPASTAARNGLAQARSLLTNPR
jgi:spermidine synthase